MFVAFEFLSSLLNFTFKQMQNCFLMYLTTQVGLNVTKTVIALVANVWRYDLTSYHRFSIGVASLLCWNNVLEAIPIAIARVQSHIQVKDLAHGQISTNLSLPHAFKKSRD